MKKLIYLLLLTPIILLTSCNSDSERKTKSDTSSTQSNTEVKKENESAWQVVQVKDEFGDIIEAESALVGTFKGTMSNSATSDAGLTVKMQILDSKIYSTFYKYNRKTKAQLPDSKFMKIKIKVSSGEVLEAEQFLYGNMMVDSDKELLNILLSQDKEVKVIADISNANKYSNEIYKFVIDPNGLKEVLK